MHTQERRPWLGVYVFVLLENRTREASPIYQSLGYVTLNKTAAAAAICYTAAAPHR